jgi:AbrB family looped-hinge helix DNA binding protein
MKPLLPLVVTNLLTREILGTSRMSSKFQITVPKEVRDRFKIKAEEIVVFSDEDGKLVLRKSIEA